MVLWLWGGCVIASGAAMHWAREQQRGEGTTAWVAHVPCAVFAMMHLYVTLCLQGEGDPGGHGQDA